MKALISMGRRAKTDAEKDRNGNPGKRARKAAPGFAAPAAPAAPPNPLDPPSWLVAMEKPDALVAWREVIAPLIELRFLRDIDFAVAARYCRHFADWLDAVRTIDKEGATVINKMTATDDVITRLHPMVKVREIAERHLLEIEDRIGVGPRARYELIHRMAMHPGAERDLLSYGARRDPASAPPAETDDGPPAPPPASPNPLGALH